MAEREHGGDPSSGCGIGRGLGRNTPYLAALAPIARAPSLAKKNTTISRKRTRRRGQQAARAGQTAPRRNRRHPRQGIKNTPSRQPEMAEREHGGDPSSGCRNWAGPWPRPPTSQRSRRSPELHHWLKRTRRFREKEQNGDAASRRPEPVKLRRAGIVGTPAKG